MSSEYESFKEQVRQAADIVEVVSSYISLKKRGNNEWGCCPFHGEKTPSFTVNVSKQFFYCFGCHEGGDVFKFVEKIEKVGFGDAVKLLANRYNIPIPEKEKSQEELRREREAETIFKANDLAGRYFNAALTKTSFGNEAMEYLAKRGIGLEIIERFTLGFALDSYNSLINHLVPRGVTREQLFKAGLVTKNDGGRIYDKFRKRVMIPIKNPRGKIVGFGGRTLGDGNPKYLNTAETSFFNKRRLLFGMDIAAGAIRRADEAIVVEGYMDCISLQAVGVETVVASLGTAFTEEQAKLLRKLTSSVVFCYDSDAAGRNSSVRAASIARRAGLKVRVAGVPEGKDPDEYIRAHGKDAFLEIIKNAPDGLNFQIEETVKKHNISNLAGKVEAVSNILPFLLECNSSIEVSAYIRDLAGILAIDEALIAEEYRKAARKGAKSPNVQVKTPQSSKERPSIQRHAEETLLAVLLAEPSYLGRVDSVIQDTGLEDGSCQVIYQGLKEGKTVMQLFDELDANAAAVLARIQSGMPAIESLEQNLEDCLLQLKKRVLERAYAEHAALALKYQTIDEERSLKELMESQRIKDEIKQLYGN